jgi:peptide/nickel transport system permease protein
MSVTPPPASPVTPAGARTGFRARFARSDLARVLASRQVRAGLGLTAAMIVVALVGPALAPHDPQQPVDLSYTGPGAGHLLGTDQLGRDVLSRLLCGGVYLAWMAPACAVAAVTLGALVGVVAAHYGGAVDVLLMRAMDILLAFPLLIFIILFVSMVGPTPWLLVTLVVVGMVPGVARVLRGAALPLREREYVLWAGAAGLPVPRILLREYLPNIWSPLMVEFGMRLMWSIGALASISFLGYGIQYPDFDWGVMIAEARTGLQIQPLAVLAPVAMIIAFTIGGNIIAEGAARVVARTEGE